MASNEFVLKAIQAMMPRVGGEIKAYKQPVQALKDIPSPIEEADLLDPYDHEDYAYDNGIEYNENDHEGIDATIDRAIDKTKSRRNPAGIGVGLVSIETPYGQISVHKDAKNDFSGFYNDLAELGAPIKKIGSYNPRKISGTNKWSEHSFGRATDMDDNLDMSPAMKQWITQNSDEWRGTLQRYNMRWGGDWKNWRDRKDGDPNHVEWIGGK